MLTIKLLMHEKACKSNKSIKRNQCDLHNVTSSFFSTQSNKSLSIAHKVMAKELRRAKGSPISENFNQGGLLVGSSCGRGLLFYNVFRIFIGRYNGVKCRLINVFSISSENVVMLILNVKRVWGGLFVPDGSRLPDIPFLK